jgi:hypothetical protein
MTSMNNNPFLPIDRLETHDRYQSFTKQDFSIAECCQDIINKRPFGNYPFYIFAHPRTDDDGITKRMLWQPRLTKPKAQTNSMLFKAYPGSDVVNVIWIIPDRPLWPQYKKGNICESQIVSESIHDFLYNRSKLEAKQDDDLNDEQIDAIYREISQKAQLEKSKENLMDRLYLKN